MRRILMRRKTRLVVLLVFMVVCISIICFQYYRNLQETIREESSGYLQEISSQIGNNIDRIISDNYSVLNTMASVLETLDAKTFADVAPVALAQQNYWNYESLMLIDENGTAYSTSGEEVLLNIDNSLSDTVLNKMQTLSTAQMVNNKEQIIFAIPLRHLELGNKEIAALATCYDPSTFDQSLSMSSFDGMASSQIVSKTGTVVVRSSTESSIKTGYNVLSSISGATMDQGSSLSQITDDFKNNRPGQIGFTLNGTKTYLVYTPIQSQDWYLITFVPADVVNARSNMLLRITLMICGLITLIFAGLLAFILFTFQNHKKKLEQIAYVDSITGGNTLGRFYELALYALDQPNKPTYALIYTNIAKFKVLNEQFGHQTCDFMLKSFDQQINTMLVRNECIGRLSGDNFCILLEYQNDNTLLERFKKWYENAEVQLDFQKTPWSLPLTEFGVYVLDNDTLPLPQIIDRAKLALRELPHSINSKLRYSIYDDNVRQRLFREKQIEDMMEQALAEGEFQVYLQPKYWVADETIGGAEALTRWVSKSEGMIFPDEFIPLFEKNGFIVMLDLWIFEQVCKQLREWLDSGLNPPCISVNCSRVHLQNPDFLKPYRKIAANYSIPHALLEIELTESVVMEDIHSLTQIIHDIHDAGFSCSMDDFGSGYSSLNMIQSIPVDTLKIDKIFFHGSMDDIKRTESVINSIVIMAKALSLKTVAEGVERRDQVEMLKKINCDMIQGYIFAKPMPMAEFEALAFDPH